MAWVSIAVAAAPIVYKGIKGISQSSKANGLNPINPGYQMNQGVIDNARTLSDYYGNYQLPGYSQMENGIDNNFQNAFSAGVQGATSGADVMDLATRMAYGKNQAFNQLGVQNAQGKQSALSAYLNANAAAGQEYVNKNAYDRDMYQGQVREKAALTQAGAENTYGAIDQLAGLGAKYGFSQLDPSLPQSQMTMGQQLGNPVLPPAQSAGYDTANPFQTNISPQVEDLLKKYGYSR